MGFILGDTDEYPVWATPLLLRRVLWKDYGIVLDDYSFEDMLMALRLHALEVQREQQTRKT